MLALCPNHALAPLLRPDESAAAMAELLEGVWLNTNPQTRDFVRLDVLSTASGLQLYLSDADGRTLGPLEWMVPFAGGPRSQDPLGFTGQVRGPEGRLHVISNFNKELLILVTFASGSGPHAWCAREFFAHIRGEPPRADLLSSSASPPPEERGEPDLDLFVGEWESVEPGLPGISRVRGRRVADGLALELFSGPPGDERRWPDPVVLAAHCAPEEPGAGSCCLLITCDLGFAQTEIMCKRSKGLLVLAETTRFLDDSGRQPFFTRNFMRSLSGV